MKNTGLLNPLLVSAVAEIGHTQMLVVADAGLPLPPGAAVIDLSVSRDIPRFMDVLRAVKQELIIDSFLYAEEMNFYNSPLHDSLLEELTGFDRREITHEQLKALLTQAKVIIRTGECSKYANVILVGGTDF